MGEITKVFISGYTGIFRANGSSFELRDHGDGKMTLEIFSQSHPPSSNQTDVKNSTFSFGNFGLSLAFNLHNAAWLEISPSGEIDLRDINYDEINVIPQSPSTADVSTQRVVEL